MVTKSSSDKTDKEVLYTRDHVEMLKRKHLWPGHYICVKRRIGSRPILDFQFGNVLADHEPGKIVVYLVQYDPAARKDVIVGCENFETYEQLVNAGWEID